MVSYVYEDGSQDKSVNGPEPEFNKVHSVNPARANPVNDEVTVVSGKPNELDDQSRKSVGDPEPEVNPRCSNSSKDKADPLLPPFFFNLPAEEIEPLTSLLTKINTGKFDPAMLNRGRRLELIEILTYGEGKKPAEIAAILKLCERTVFRDIKNIKAQIMTSLTSTLDGSVRPSLRSKNTRLFEIVIRFPDLVTLKFFTWVSNTWKGRFI